MAQPLYFLPGLTKDALAVGDKFSPAVLADRGLIAAFGDIRSVQRECYVCELNKGPGGSSGLLLAYQTPDTKLPTLTSYVPGQQEWTECLPGKMWLAIEKANPPSEADLRRTHRHNGYNTNIAGEKYLVPIIRRMNDTTELPRDMYWDTAGNLLEPVKAAYHKWWNESEEVCKWFFQEGWQDYTKSRGLSLAIEAVGINYRYGRHEHNVLRLIDVDSHLSVLMASVDVPGADALETAEKKSK